MDDPEPAAFQHYRILRHPDGSLWKLGAGAMGVTYKAIDDHLHKVVALKVINATHIEKASSRDRFIREARAAAGLTHRNIAGVYYLGQDTQSFFYAMEFIDGETVEALVKRTGPQPWPVALGIVVQVTRALMAAHERQLVHRDIKPANIMLVPELGEDTAVVKLIDFGLVKSLAERNDAVANVTASGFVGTPAYASPEQCNEDIPDTRSDIYSLGVTLWYLLMGKPPFTGTIATVFAQHLGKPPPLEQLPADLPEPVRALLGRMLAKDPVDRPQTPDDLRRELEACLRAPAPANTPVVPVVLPPSARSGWLWRMVAMAAAATVLAVAGFWLNGRNVLRLATKAPPGTPLPSPVSTAALTPPPPPTAAPTPTPIPDFRLVTAKAWIEKARGEAESLKGSDDKAFALARVAIAQAIAGDATGSRDTLAAAFQTAQTLKVDYQKATALRGIANAQAQTHNFAAALGTARAIFGNAHRAAALADIVDAQSWAGDITAALQTAQEIEDGDSKATALRLIAIAQVRVGDSAAALRTVEGIKGDSDKIIALRDIAAAQAKVGDAAGSRQAFAAALKLVKAIRDNPDAAAVALRDIAAAQALAGDAAGSRQTFAAAVNMAQTIFGEAYQAAALGDIAAAQAVAGDAAGSMGAFAAALPMATALVESPSKDKALRMIAAAQARAGRSDAAMETVKMIREHSGFDDKDAALADIAIVQAKASAIKLALETTQGIKDERRKAAARFDIALAQAKAGDLDAASATLGSLLAGKHRCLAYTFAAKILMSDVYNPEDE